MRHFFSYIAIGCLAIYWGVTLLFVGPDNYIKISFLEGQEFFDTFLYQKWGFFAPPPKYNDRLYYVFENKSDSTDTKTFEVIAPLQRMKTSKAPFNSAEDILDYVLSSSLHSVSDGLVAVNESLSYQQDVGEMEEVTDEIRIEKGRIYTQTTTNFQTLKNYAVFVAAKNHIDINNYYVRIEMTQIDMPKFADRNKLNSPTGHEESLVFKSDKFTIERK